MNQIIRHEKKVTKSDQNWLIKKQDFVKCLEINHLQSPVVPRAGARRLVAIVYSWWLLKVLSIKWLNYPGSVFK